MDLTERINLLPDNVRRQILHAVCDNSGTSKPGPRNAGPTTADKEAQNIISNDAFQSMPKTELTPCGGSLPGVNMVAGACVVDGFISPDEVKEALADAQLSLAEEHQQAAVGGALPLASAGRQVDTEARGDQMRWLHREREAAARRGALAALMARMEALRHKLERQGYTVGGKPTYQLACYPGGGARYVRHADASVSCPTRTLTAIVYLNEPGWDVQTDGGSLALYNVPYSGALRGAGVDAGEPATVVAPLGGRLLVFESHLFHEVLPAHRNRYAVTAWFHREAPAPPREMSPLGSWPSAMQASLPAPQPPPPVPSQSGGGAAAAATATATAVAVAEDIAAAASAATALAEGADWERPDGATAGGAGSVDADAAAGPSAGAAAGADTAAGVTATGSGLDDHARIFVSVAAYRDPEGPWTLHSLFSRAHRPERVRVGVVWQIDPATEAAFAGVAGAARSHPEWLHQVRQVVLPYGEAEGPCKARALAQSLWSGEEYVLQIDSHMRMVSGWDTICIQQLAAAEAASATGKAVLSTYPLGYSGSGAAASVPDEAAAPATLLCARGFESDGFLRTFGRVLRARPAAPLPSRFWAAGLSFTRSQWLRDVPYCPYLPHLFFGEESYMLVRMWTRGWDVFAPSVPLAFHQWERSARQHTYQADLRAEDGVAPGDASVQASGGGALARAQATAKQRSQERVLRVLAGGPPYRVSCAAGMGLEGDPAYSDVGREGGHGDIGTDWAAGGVWGLGRARSLAQLAEASGVDYVARTVSKAAMWGGLGEQAFEL